ncbi:MAG TPA: hypothetical protein VJ673_21900 [Aromatoleum sp.]|uniref:hypothetical protein n=1 Tax=Aromatoleum sp. TaxID=2307007 RepID=UPI002B482F97|nr:hypothetical protein [Aromatoleum sp.]HJV28346.1 hypothetical protein [Aromatoleum sp.]
MSTEDIELLRLLARFKLQLRRLHDRAVDLAALMADRDYADAILSDIEDLTDDEELLVLVLQLRARLLKPVAPPAVSDVAVPGELPAAQVDSPRHYRYGARGG